MGRPLTGTRAAIGECALRLGIYLAVLVATTHFAAAQSADGVTGRWLTADGKSVIAIDRCGDFICGKIDWLQAPADAQPGLIPRDQHNHDPALRKQPICGLKII